MHLQLIQGQLVKAIEAFIVYIHTHTTLGWRVDNGNLGQTVIVTESQLLYVKNSRLSGLPGFVASVPLDE